MAVRFAVGEILTHREDKFFFFAALGYFPVHPVAAKGKAHLLDRACLQVEQSASADQNFLEELIDRFGEPPKAVLNLLAIARLKALAHRGYITEIKQMQREIRITLYENAHLNPEGIPPLVAKYRRQLQFKPDKEPKFLFAPVGDIVQALTVFAKELMELVEDQQGE